MNDWLKKRQPLSLINFVLKKVLSFLIIEKDVIDTYLSKTLSRNYCISWKL